MCLLQNHQKKLYSIQALNIPKKINIIFFLEIFKASIPIEMIKHRNNLQLHFHILAHFLGGKRRNSQIHAERITSTGRGKF